MYSKFKLLIFGSLLMLGACKKTDLPPPVEGNPIFSVNATLDGQALDIVAGEEDFYLFTSYQKDDQEVFSFTGRFEKLIDCQTDCLEKLEIEIRDFEMNFGSASTSIEQSLATGSLAFVNSEVVQADTMFEGYEVVFENRSIANVDLNYNWEFGNGEMSQEKNPAKRLYDSSFINIAPLVKLTVSDSTGLNCTSTFEQPLTLDSINQSQDCAFGNFTIQDSIPPFICASMTGVSPFSYEWQVDSFIDNGTCFSLANVLNGNASFLSLTGIDATGCIVTRSVSFLGNPINSTVTFCAADFAYSASEKWIVIPPSDSLNLSQVIIRYTDSDGLLYTSDLASQTSGDSQFEILESTDYEVNENGEKTRQLKIRFSANLQNADGKILSLKNGVGVIAVAYP